MAGTDAGRPAGVDFEEFARARQGTSVRAAFLVCGDEELAENRLRAALLALARHWNRVRHEEPDLFVRRTLYRDVVTSCPSGAPTGHRPSRRSTGLVTAGTPRPPAGRPPRTAGSRRSR